MAKLKALTLAGVAILAMTGLAAAADLLPPPPALEPLPAAAALNGWYLRGDVGVGADATTASLVNDPDPLAAGTLGAGANQSFNNTSFSASALFDIGVGYQVNPWLRGDVTLEYRGGGHFQSLYVLNAPASGGNTQYADFYRASTSSVVGLINVYADLGTWYGVTPFVGAGIGMSHNNLFGMTDNGQVTSGAGATGPSGGYFSDGGTNNLAWALMAGLDFDVSQNLKLELGYRYLNLGKYSSGASNCLNGTGTGTGFSLATCGGSSNYVRTSNTLASNDFRLGLIWMLGAETAPAAAPLVRKY